MDTVYVVTEELIYNVEHNIDVWVFADEQKAKDFMEERIGKMKAEGGFYNPIEEESTTFFEIYEAGKPYTDCWSIDIRITDLIK